MFRFNIGCDFPKAYWPIPRMIREGLPAVVFHKRHLFSRYLKERLEISQGNGKILTSCLCNSVREIVGSARTGPAEESRSG
jgi:hypothetical protein